MGLWFTEAKLEGVVLKAAWHWGSDNSVVNDRPGEPSRTQLYVGFPSLTGDPKECVREGSGNGRLSPYGPRWGTSEGSLLYRGI
jgi:hypothetical protein